MERKSKSKFLSTSLKSKKVAERAWLALTDYVDEKGAVSNVSSFYSTDSGPPVSPL